MCFVGIKIGLVTFCVYAYVNKILYFVNSIRYWNDSLMSFGSALDHLRSIKISFLHFAPKIRFLDVVHVIPVSEPSQILAWYCMVFSISAGSF